MTEKKAQEKQAAFKFKGLQLNSFKHGRAETCTSSKPRKLNSNREAKGIGGGTSAKSTPRKDCFTHLAVEARGADGVDLVRAF